MKRLPLENTEFSLLPWVSRATPSVYHLCLRSLLQRMVLDMLSGICFCQRDQVIIRTKRKPYTHGALLHLRIYSARAVHFMTIHCAVHLKFVYFSWCVMHFLKKHCKQSKERPIFYFSSYLGCWVISIKHKAGRVKLDQGPKPGSGSYQVPWPCALNEDLEKGEYNWKGNHRVVHSQDSS